MTDHGHGVVGDTTTGAVWYHGWHGKFLGLSDG